MCISWTQNPVIQIYNHTWEYCKDFWPKILNPSISEDWSWSSGISENNQSNKCALLRSLNFRQKWGYSNLLASLRNPSFCIFWLNKTQLPLPVLTPWKAAVWSWLICLGTLYTLLFRSPKRLSQEFQFYKGLKALVKKPVRKCAFTN